MSFKIESRAVALADGEKIVACNSAIEDTQAKRSIFLTDQNRIGLFDWGVNSQRFVRSLEQDVDISKAIDIHIYKNYVAIVNRRGTNGFVIDMEDPKWIMKLERGDYHVEHCTFAIGMIERDRDVHMIHATDWNRLDITKLATKQCLTERHIGSASDENEDSNYLDYFHSSMLVSPNESKFIVNGWVWSPWDVFFLWSVEEFLIKFEPGYRSLKTLETSGYNWDRPICFIDNETIAWGYNQREENNVPDDHPSEIVAQRLADNKIVSRTTADHFQLTDVGEVQGELNYDTKHDWFYLFGPEQPLMAIDLSGTLKEQADFVPVACSRSGNIFTRFSDQEIAIARYE